MKLIKLPPFEYNPGDKSQINQEVKLDKIIFNIHKFSDRARPSQKENIVIIPAFSEFGCESLIPLYAIPWLLKNRHAGRYCIVLGWYGREFLYRHLVDEYWEIKEEFQHLREYCRAFHHESKNLANVELQAAELGRMVTTNDISHVFLYPRLQECIIKRGEAKCDGRVATFQEYQRCQKCGFAYKPVGIFDDCSKSQKLAKWVPLPNIDKIEKAKNILPPNAVGITARNRKCYGRNLDARFYERLIWKLEDLGYNPVWLGEKVTTLPCPIKRIPDLSGHKDARDLEQTLAYVSQMEFTIQFWTASTRLAGLVGTPFIIFESPDQIWGGGQEGYRLHLTSKGPKKLVVAHFRSVAADYTKAMKVVENAVIDIRRDDYSTIIGMVENEQSVRNMILSKLGKINWF